MSADVLGQAQQDERAAELDERVVLRVEVGSTAHGVTHSTNDMDEIAVYVPSPSEMLGLSCPEGFTYRPGRGPHDPSGPGDLDRTYYSLRKFVSLLAKGNPSILYTLHGPVLEANAIGYLLRSASHKFRNNKTRNAYLGYAKDQRERIQGTRGAAGRMRRSPEGDGEIDWKYAMHMLRLGIQGVEYFQTGHISSPSLELDYLKAVRAGEVELFDVVAKALDNEAKLFSMGLPANAEYNSWMDELLVNAHVKTWKDYEEI